MQGYVPKRAPIAAGDPRDLALPNFCGGPGRADQHPAEQSRLQAHEAPSRAAERRPVLSAPVKGFRIVQRVGQALVAMVCKMCSAIVLVGKPKRKRPRADKSVEPALARRMAVDCLVLQAGLPGDRPSRDRNEGPNRQAVVEKSSP